mgnify:CR=1 FL=1
MANPVPAVTKSHSELRDELETVNRKLLLHNRGETLLSDDDYKIALRRSLEIIGGMNTTIATPKTAKGKGSAKKAGPSVLTLDDL